MLTNEYIFLQSPVHVSIQVGFVIDPGNDSLCICVVEICQYITAIHPKSYKYPNWSNFIFHAPGQASQHLLPGLLQTTLGSGVRTGNNIMFCILSAWLVAGPQKHRERIFGGGGGGKTHLTLVSLAGESYRLWGHYSGLSEGNMKEMGGWWENIILSLMRRSIP